MSHCLEVFTDSDWASCETSRRSRTGCVIQYSGYTVCHFTRTQEAISLSTTEAELRASCKGVMEALGIREMINFLFGTDCELHHFTDASGAFGAIKRRGAGSMKHLTIRELWIQDTMREPFTKCSKIPRSENPADMMCSISDLENRKRHLEKIRCEPC